MSTVLESGLSPVEGGIACIAWPSSAALRWIHSRVPASKRWSTVRTLFRPGRLGTGTTRGMVESHDPSATSTAAKGSPVRPAPQSSWPAPLVTESPSAWQRQRRAEYISGGLSDSGSRCVHGRLCGHRFAASYPRTTHAQSSQPRPPAHTALSQSSPARASTLHDPLPVPLLVRPRPGRFSPFISRQLRPPLRTGFGYPLHLALVAPSLQCTVRHRCSAFRSQPFIVAAILSYPQSPYGSTTSLSSQTSGTEAGNAAAPRQLFPHPFELRPVSPSRAHRWSRKTTYVQGDRRAEEAPMPGDGPGSRLPPLNSRQHADSDRGFSPRRQQSPSSVTHSFHSEHEVELHRGARPRASSASMMSEARLGSDRRASRPLGVQSILNPAYGEEEEKRGRRRSAAQMEENSPPYNVRSPIHSISRPPSAGSDMHGATSPTDSHAPRGVLPRRILTPISPTIHRAASMGRLNTGTISTGSAPTGTIDAHQSPFLSLNDPHSSRIHTAQPGAPGIPPMPVYPSTETSHRYSLPHSTTPPIAPYQLPRRQSVSSAVHSTRVSPTPSFPLSNRSGQASPALPYAQSASVTPHYGRSPSLGAMSGPMDSDQPFGMTVVQSGQSSYQLLTIDSAKGPVQVPVEVQAGSRVADEKRKRNAGASARFRARRKEKERESSSKIQVLEQQLRDALDELDWFKKERDDLMGALRQVPGGDRYLVRDKSPRSRKDGGNTLPSSALPSPAFPYERPHESERHIRRRTESYSLPPTPSATGQPNHAGSYFAQSPYQAPAQLTQARHDSASQRSYRSPSPRPVVAGHSSRTPQEQYPHGAQQTWSPGMGPQR